MRKEDKGVIIGQLAETVKQYGHFYLVDTTAMDAAKTSELNVTGHKDEEVCRYLAEKVSAGKKTTVVCTGGIHMDGITKEQIAEIVEAMRIIAGEIVDK